jgi:hypothetical protein
MQSSLNRVPNVLEKPDTFAMPNCDTWYTWYTFPTLWVVWSRYSFTTFVCTRFSDAGIDANSLIRTPGGYLLFLSRD